jgi:prevent-host-death family protein
MARHSVADAKNNLSQLIDRAMNGEEVVITRHGTETVALTPIGDKPKRKPRPMTQAEVEWLDRIALDLGPDSPDSATLIRQMRDEGY